MIIIKMRNAEVAKRYAKLSEAYRFKMFESFWHMLLCFCVFLGSIVMTEIAIQDDEPGTHFIWWNIKALCMILLVPLVVRTWILFYFSLKGDPEQKRELPATEDKGAVPAQDVQSSRRLSDE